MTIVAGVDFGTLSVRVSIVDREHGRIGFRVSEYPLQRKREDPDLRHAMPRRPHERPVPGDAAGAKEAGVPGEQIEAIALDTTGSSVIPVGAGLTPLDDYYLWCDHRAKREAAEITELAHREKLEAIDWCGGIYSSEWGFAKLLHWLRNNPGLRESFVSAFEHCDMVAATLCGITDPEQVKRSVCAMGHKWMWNAALGGLPPEEFPRRGSATGWCARETRRPLCDLGSNRGNLTPPWAAKLGLRAGIPIPVGAFDAHWDAIGAGRPKATW